jgi:hypothetical protein
MLGTRSFLEGNLEQKNFKLGFASGCGNGLIAKTKNLL